MRCASCGTENAPDSRFCGGCGARIGASGPRVAPTQKISDEAPYPKVTPAPVPIAHSAAQQSGPRAIPRTPYVPSVPPSQPIVTQPGVPQRPASAPPPYAPVPTPLPAMSPPAIPAATPSSPSASPHAPNGASRPTPSISMPTMARRPWRLIIIVLILDAALAGVGAWMLSQGLSDKTSGKTLAPRTGAVTPAAGDPQPPQSR